MRQVIYKNIYNLFLFLIGVLFICGGLGVRLYWVEIAGFLLAGLLTILIYNLKENIKFPPAILTYFPFVLILLFSLIWSKNLPSSLEFFFLFTTGGFIWILFYSLKDKILLTFSPLMISLGVGFFILFLLHKFFKIDFVDSAWNLYGKYTTTHNHIGDYWVIVVLAIVNLMLAKTRPWHLVILPLGIILIAISLSRSAYIALFAGLLYFFLKDKFNKYKKFFWSAVLLIAVMIIASGFTKTTFFSRPYFLQVILGIFKNPFGLGMGNFIEVSKINNSFLGSKNTALHTHNIFLEVFSGIGIFGIIFVFWFIKVLGSILKNKDEKSLIYQAIFLAITTNFLFDTTYYLPTMLWLWFAVLGLSQP